MFLNIIIMNIAQPRIINKYFDESKFNKKIEKYTFNKSFMVCSIDKNIIDNQFDDYSKNVIHKEKIIKYECTHELYYKDMKLCRNYYFCTVGTQ